MKLFERDYTIITPEEKAEWEVEEGKEIVYMNGERTDFRNPLFRYYPKAARHFLSLFPNNYLDTIELHEIERLTDIVNQFEQLFQSDSISEREILKFIKEKEAYFIIGSILTNNYNFGHHHAFVFPEFMMGNSYQTDYLIVGGSSGVWQFVFVEFESPLGRITTQDGNFAQVFQKGIRQTEKWDTWIEANYPSLKETFDRYVHPK